MHDDCDQLTRDCVRDKRQLFGAQLIKHNAQAIEIRAIVDWFIARLFGREVSGRTDDGTQSRETIDAIARQC